MRPISNLFCSKTTISINKKTFFNLTSQTQYSGAGFLVSQLALGDIKNAGF